ncbi:MAG: DUF4040 domain-containing protein [Idiomarina sp.]|nr:DUF4040 domain-containing protein [Idiomarina sp.]
MIAFDILLGLGMLLAAAGVFWSADLFRAIVMFVVFGVLLALAWLRLQAPDLALAEAAIGAGLTGVLLLDTLSVLRAKKTAAGKLPPVDQQLLNTFTSTRACAAQNNHGKGHENLRFLAVGLLSLGILIALQAALFMRPEAAVNLPSMVAEGIPDAGIEHPITAVLLNFRSYDTLLEVAVLLVAVIIGLSLRIPSNSNEQQAPSSALIGARQAAYAGVISEDGGNDPILRNFTQRLIPLVLVTGGYILWAGSTMPGGAFQAGALIAAAGVIARLAGYNIASRVDQLLRFGLVLGFLVFLTVAASVMFGGRPFLNYPDGWAGSLIFFIEAMLTFSIGLTLLSLFVHSPGDGAEPNAKSSQRSVKSGSTVGSDNGVGNRPPGNSGKAEADHD